MKVRMESILSGKRAAMGLMGVAAVLLSVVIGAQQGDLTHGHAGVPSAMVDFGVLPTGPLGPPPCLQTGAIGGPTDPSRSSAR
jgi:hypothetical protein